MKILLLIIVLSMPFLVLGGGYYEPQQQVQQTIQENSFRDTTISKKDNFEKAIELLQAIGYVLAGLGSLLGLFFGGRAGIKAYNRNIIRKAKEKEKL